MQENGFLIVLMAVAVAAALWFRRRPLSSRQRVIVVAICIGLLVFDFLGRGEADWGRVAIVLFGSAVLVMAAIFVTRSQGGQE